MTEQPLADSVSWPSLNIVSEKAFNQAVVDTARRWGWLVYHSWNSQHSAAGWPDLAMVRDGRLILAELKIGQRKVRPDQEEWLDALRRVGPPVEVKVWRWPDSWDDIIRTLAPKKAIYLNGVLTLAV